MRYMKRQPVGGMLDAWFGRERACAEKLRFLPPTRRLSEIMDKVAERAFPPGSADFFRILEDWPKIAGAEIARRATPFSLEGDKLLVEISHPAWLSHFRSPAVKKALLDKIQASLGKPLCKDISFIPAGRRCPGPGGQS